MIIHETTIVELNEFIKKITPLIEFFQKEYPHYCLSLNEGRNGFPLHLMITLARKNEIFECRNAIEKFIGRRYTDSIEKIHHLYSDFFSIGWKPEDPELAYLSVSTCAKEEEIRPLLGKTCRIVDDTLELSTRKIVCETDDFSQKEEV